MLEIVMFEGENVQKKIRRENEKRESSLRECENPNCRKQFNNLKRTCDACKSKVSSQDFLGNV